jgi:2-dehydro-3-deoxyphosphogluconate aldolase/(4S)-4-hydroxy-2-oxoglutarate aldolase
MSKKQRNLQLIEDTGVVAIIRIDDRSKVMPIFDALMEGGVKCIEITMSTPKAIDAIEEAASKLPSGMLLGVGTVLDAETARAAILAGAEYVVSPITDFDTIRLCQRYDKIVIPGAYTPTEIVRAWEAGADIVKVFPASVGGPGYIKALRGPLPQIALQPTGGVTVENSAEFIQAGATAVGIGGALVDKRAVVEGKFEIIRDGAARLISSIIEVKKA